MARRAPEGHTGTVKTRRVVVPFRLRQDLIPALDRAAKRAGRKRSQYVEDVVTEAIKRGRAA